MLSCHDKQLPKKLLPEQQTQIDQQVARAELLLDKDDDELSKLRISTAEAREGLQARWETARDSLRAKRNEPSVKSLGNVDVNADLKGDTVMADTRAERERAISPTPVAAQSEVKEETTDIADAKEEEMILDEEEVEY